MSKPEMGAGDISVHLEDHGEVILRPTLQACRTLSSGPGGVAKMVERCGNFEFDAILTVITAGIGKTSKDLPELIYKTGLLELSAPCINFLHTILNGGRPISELKEEGEDDPLEKSSQ